MLRTSTKVGTKLKRRRAFRRIAKHDLAAEHRSLIRGYYHSLGGITLFAKIVSNKLTITMK